MALTFPRTNETILCPHCRRQCQFVHTSPPPPKWSIGGAIPGAGQHSLTIAYCTYCGECAVQKHTNPAGNAGSRTEYVYPTAPTRSIAPDLVRAEDEHLANCYDGAVNCEPHSNEAAVFLLGRCAEIILVTKCDAPKGKTLGVQIPKCKASGKLTDQIATWLTDAFKHARDQATHYWVSESGEVLLVDTTSVDRAFAVVDAMFKEYYINPHDMEEWAVTMGDTRNEKLKGDKPPVAAV